MAKSLNGENFISKHNKRTTQGNGRNSRPKKHKKPYRGQGKR